MHQMPARPTERVDHAAEHADLSAEEKGNAVKAEKAHAAPVERADDSKRQRDLVDDHEVPSLKRWFGLR